MSVVTLKDRATIRIQKAFRPGTVANNTRAIKKYKHFCTMYNFKRLQPTHRVIILFLEHLTDSVKSFNAIKNVISAIKSYLQIRGVSIRCFSHIKVKHMIKALQATLLPPAHKVILSPAEVKQIMSKAATYGKARHAIRLAIILGFAGFLRRSNIAPETPQTFDKQRHTTPRDLAIKGNNLAVNLKWTKTLQNSRGTVIVLPTFKSSTMDPASVYKKYLRATPGLRPKGPLLRLPDGAILTARTLAGMLARLAGSKDVTLHTLRRSGTSQAFLGGASSTQLSVHGTWISSAFHRYIISQSNMNSPIQEAFDARF